MPGPSEELKARSRAGVVSGAIGGALLALAGHLELLRKFGTVLPYRDQWKCTAIDILQPWVEGRLGWRDFFQPLNDHWPVLTRALSFLLVRLNGQWNNLLETSVNALLFASAIAMFLLMILPGLRGWTRPAFALLTGTVFALPITWENTLWGIQSLVYLQIALSLVYFATVCVVRRFSFLWWSGQVVGVALLLTQHSAILAHFAVIVLLAWRWWRSDGDRRVNATGLTLACVAIFLFAAFFPSLKDTAGLRADSWAIGLDVFLRQLAWPLPHPAWAFFIYLPWVVWMVDRFTARRMDACDAFILVVGLWVGAQAAAIGYGRGAATYTFVSRYCDFLALGLLVNAACLIRLSLAFPSKRMRAGLMIFALVWLLAPVKSFHWESTESHAGYNLSRRASENARNLTALRTYFENKDASLISDDNGRGLYSYPPALPPLLDHPGLQALLPPEAGSPQARADHGRLGWIPALLILNANGVTGAAVVFIALSALATRRRRTDDEPSVLSPGQHTWKTAAILLTAIGVASAIATLAWESPGVFNRSERLRRLFFPERAGIAFTALEFQRGDGSEHPMIAAAAGALETMPPDSRAFGYGTRLPVAPDFRGILHSQAFVVRTRYLIIPFSGYPCANGNGLRWRFFNPATKEEKWVSYVGSNPGVNWDMWSIEAADYRGSEASLYLFDGREDESGWVGVGRPAQADENFSARWIALLRQERADSAHVAMAGLAAASLFAALAITLIGRDRIRRSASRATPT